MGKHQASASLEKSGLDSWFGGVKVRRESVKSAQTSDHLPNAPLSQVVVLFVCFIVLFSYFFFGTVPRCRNFERHWTEAIASKHQAL